MKTENVEGEKKLFPLCIWYSIAVLNKLYYRIFSGFVLLAKFRLP